MARRATLAGPSVSGKPWPRLTEPVASARADISVKIVVPNGASRRLSRGRSTALFCGVHAIWPPRVGGCRCWWCAICAHPLAELVGVTLGARWQFRTYHRRSLAVAGGVSDKSGTANGCRSAGAVAGGRPQGGRRQGRAAAAGRAAAGGEAGRGGRAGDGAGGGGRRRRRGGRAAAAGRGYRWRMRIALCQIPVSPDPAINLARVKSALAEAGAGRADLAVFPERRRWPDSVPIWWRRRSRWTGRSVPR